MRFSTVFALCLGVFLLGLGCGHREQPKSVDKEDYVGDWKVENPQLGTYFMTLNPDGSGSSTLTGGELGQWQWKADHIELEWTPKNLTFYFDSGKSTPKNQPSLSTTEKSVAEKVKR